MKTIKVKWTFCLAQKTFRFVRETMELDIEEIHCWVQVIYAFVLTRNNFVVAMA